MEAEPPPGDLVIVSAHDATPGRCLIMVDATVGDPLIDPSGADPTKWSMRLSNTLYTGKAIANTAFNEFEVLFNVSGFEPGSDRINYTNAPSDIATVSGHELPAVSDVPITP